MTGSVFDSRLERESKKRTTFGAFLYRQFFITPALLRDIDLTSKIAIITRSNIDIGLEYACHFSDIGLEKLILAIYNKAKG